MIRKERNMKTVPPTSSKKPISIASKYLMALYFQTQLCRVSAEGS